MFVWCYTVVWNISDMKDEKGFNTVQKWIKGEKPRTDKKNPGGGEIFSTRPDRPWGPPSLLYNGYRVIPGSKAAGAWR
jgi:hypothetical protein